MPELRATSTQEVQDVVRRARVAQAKWAQRSFAERKAALLKLRDVISARTDELVEAIVRETGKPKFEALVHEVVPIIDLTHFFATRAQSILSDEAVRLHLLWPLKRGYIQYRPRGVIGVIAPWNFPWAIPMGDVVMALSAGNAVVVKPSEWTPHIMLKVKELVVEAGMDGDLVGIVPGYGETGAALVESGVDMLVFTGSVATGRKVAAACGARLIPCVMELGGKDAAIVFADVDVDQVAAQVVHGAFANAGQVCASFERVLVHESIAEPFVAKVVELTEALRMGPPPTAQGDYVDVGAMVVPSQVEIVASHIADAREKGAEVLTGGLAQTIDGGRFFAPTVLTGVTDEMRCWNEETFGPTLPIRTFASDDQAIAMANASEYGLNAYVFSGSVARAEETARRLDAGGIVINDFFFHHAAPEVPWGGVKHSGLGRVHGRQGLKDLCEQHFIALPRTNIKPFWIYPYNDEHYNLFHKWLRGLYSRITSRFL